MDHTKQDCWQFWRIAFNNFSFRFYCRTHKKAWGKSVNLQSCWNEQQKLYNALLSFSLHSIQTLYEQSRTTGWVCVDFKQMWKGWTNKAFLCSQVASYWVLAGWWSDHHCKLLVQGLQKRLPPSDMCSTQTTCHTTTWPTLKRKSPTPSNTTVLLWISFH